MIAFRPEVFMRYVAIAGLLVACGGGGATTTTHEPQGGGPTDAGQAADTGPTTTTTILSGDAGELQGMKLETTHGPTTLDGGSHAPPPLNPAEHDPGRSQADLVAIIGTHRPEARACYDVFVKTHPGVKGNVDITWKLDPKGTVVETGVNDDKSDIHDAILVKCIGDVLRKIPWAPSPRGVETKAHYPFNFNPH
jgi:hypothetical protein